VATAALLVPVFVCGLFKYKKGDALLTGKRLMGLDLGEKNIGVAVSDEMWLTAQPLMVLRRTKLKEDIRRIKDLCAEYHVEEIVLGYPLNMNGTTGEAAREAENFREHILKASGLTVHLWDERLTTSYADKALLEGDMSRSKRKKARDKIAASLILDSFLKARSRQS